jgi:hypothetical protein
MVIGENTMSKVIYEGWTADDFIRELEPQVEMIMSGETITKPFSSRGELAAWCRDNQPYYKKNIPEVVKHFAKQYNIR